MKSFERIQPGWQRKMPAGKASHCEVMELMRYSNCIPSLLISLRARVIEYYWDELLSPFETTSSEQTYFLREHLSELKIYLRCGLKELEPYHLDLEMDFQGKDVIDMFNSKLWRSLFPIVFNRLDAKWSSANDQENNNGNRSNRTTACDLISSLLKRLASIEAYRKELLCQNEGTQSLEENESFCLVCFEKTKQNRHMLEKEVTKIEDAFELKNEIRSHLLFQGDLHTCIYGYSREPQQRYLFWTLDARRIQYYSSYGSFINGDSPLQSHRVSEVFEIRKEIPSLPLIYNMESRVSRYFHLKINSDEYLLWSSKEAELESFIMRLAFTRCRDLQDICNHSFKIDLSTWACLRHEKPVETSIRITDIHEFESNYSGTSNESDHCSSRTSQIFPSAYRIIAHLGHGSFGFVKKVQRKSDGTYFAAKFLEKSRVKVKDDHDHPLEIVTLFSVSHSNIAKPIEVFDQKDYMVLVMEMYGDGTDLFNMIEKSDGGLNEETAKLIFFQVLEASCYLFDKGYLHGDIKDENVIVESSTYHATLIDFGSCYRYTNSTNEFFYYGSEKNAAPEVVLGEPFNPEAQEIWSLGALLYSILFGQDPLMTLQEVSIDPTESVSLSSNRGGLNVDAGDASSHPFFSLSEPCQNLIRRLLGPSRDRHKSLKEILEDPWVVSCHSSSFS